MPAIDIKGILIKRVMILKIGWRYVAIMRIGITRMDILSINLKNYLTATLASISNKLSLDTTKTLLALNLKRVYKYFILRKSTQILHVTKDRNT